MKRNKKIPNKYNDKLLLQFSQNKKIRSTKKKMLKIIQ